MWERVRVPAAGSMLETGFWCRRSNRPRPRFPCPDPTAIPTVFLFGNLPDRSTRRADTLGRQDVATAEIGACSARRRRVSGHSRRYASVSVIDRPDRRSLVLGGWFAVDA
ncbi:hypothetical protein Franean1_3267 [Parafrankia sp. EAN1pec]|nr:hypothetical protein Franean1_3267 [Frankia sp. EAN1pec]